VADFRRQIRLADDLGYAVIGVGDSPNRGHEMYVSLTVAAHAVRCASIAAMVTTPELRHPLVTASAMSALHDLTGGRAVLGVGNGGSAMRVIGRAPATLAELREYLVQVRQILEGGSARVSGRATEPLLRARRVPLYLAADGPRTLELAGELADGVITTVGMSAARVHDKVAAVRRAAERAGRDPAALDVWGYTFASVCATRDEAYTDLASALSSTVAYRFRARHARATVPPELLDALAEYERRYDPSDMVIGGPNAQLLSKLGLLELGVDFGGIAGTGPETAAHLTRLEEAGVTCVLATLPPIGDPEGTLRGLASQPK
jgi:alkanesulfonate monooxygenase SsuD/methylene tetrahydromethanopterin reductase-like flavin-dependent oxidoreductase (luciferase family)